MPLYTCERSGWLRLTRNAWSSKFPIRARVSLLRVRMRRYTTRLSRRKFRNCFRFVTCPTCYSLGNSVSKRCIFMNRISQRKTSDHKEVCLCHGYRIPRGACPATAASQDPGIPHARRDLLTKGRAAAEAGAQPLTFTPRRTSSAEQHQHKAHSSAFDIRPFAFEKFFELREIKQNKTAEKNKEPEVTLSKLQIGNLIHLPAHRHTHLACLYLYA